MALFGNLRRWLNGSFFCVECGREFHVMTFGCGTAVCPDCYDGERPFLFLDDGYWLNRVMMKIHSRNTSVSEHADDEDTLIHLLANESSEIEVIS